MLHDLRLGLRLLAKSPSFTLLAILSLALGIGANTAVFSLVNEFLLRALPVREPERLVIFRNVQAGDGGLSRSNEGYGKVEPDGGFSTTSFPLRTLEVFREQRDVLEHTFAFAPFWQSLTVVNGEPVLEVTGQLASANYFEGLGVSAQLGRVFSAEQDQPGATPVAVISHRFWQRTFGGAPDVIGRTFEFNKVNVTIIGVTPPAFRGAGQAGEYFDVTVPLAQFRQFLPGQEAKGETTYWWVRIMARLAPGVTADQARAKLEPLFQQLALDGWLASPRSPNESAAKPPSAPLLRADPGARGENDTRRQYTRSLQMMLGLVGLVLLAACANVANLLLARGAARRREIAVRLALGASRARIVRQLLAESLLLAAGAAALGIVLAWWSRDALLAMRPLGGASANLTLGLDVRVLGFTIAATLVTALAFGLAPALRATKLDLTEEFQGGSRTAAGTRSWLSRSLMVVQIALSLVLLVATGLLIRSLQNLQNVDAGFNRDALVAFRVDALSAGYKPEQFTALQTRIQERVAAIPGVTAVTFTRNPLLSQSSQTSTIEIPGLPVDDKKPLNVRMNGVAENFFSALQMPVLLGRAFDARDVQGAPPVAVVNQSFVDKYLGPGNPVGRRFKFLQAKDDIEIVGVVRDAKYTDLRSPFTPIAYFPAAQRRGGQANYLVRTTGEPGAVFNAVRAAVREIDPTLPVLNPRTLEEQINRLHAQELLFAKLSGLFGALALVLASIGLYGLMSYAVVRRTAEVGVRMALGALPRQVLALFLRESLVLVLIGIAIGAAGAWGASQLLTKMLFGLSPTDPVTYALACAVMLVVALLAALLPARRAAKLEPTVALRTE